MILPIMIWMLIYVKTNNKSTQNWLIVESIDKNGIIKIKNKNIFIKLIKIQWNQTLLDIKQLELKI